MNISVRFSRISVMSLVLRTTFICLLLGAVSASAQWSPIPYVSGPIYFTGGNVGIGTSDTSLANGADSGLVIGGDSPALRIRSNELQNLGGPRVGVATFCGDYQLSSGALPSGSSGFAIFDLCAALPRLTINPSGIVDIGSLRTDTLAVGSTAMVATANSSGGLISTVGGFSIAPGMTVEFQEDGTPVVSPGPAQMTVTQAGRVGVGTTAPIHLLDVSGTPSVNGGATELLGLYDTRSFAAGVGGGIAFGGKINATGTTAQNFASIQGIKENATSGDTASAMLFFTHLNGATPSERMRIGSDGLVTVGATGGTGQKLAVNGSIRSFSGGFQFPDGTIQATAAAASPWVAGASNAIYYSAGNVGIGTTTPAFPLAVNGVVQSLAGGFKFPDGTTQTSAAISSQWGQSGTSIYYSAGNVGIGTTTPAFPLAVNGVIQSLTGGFKFPDGTTQTSAAINSQWGQSGTSVYYSAGNVGLGTTTPVHTFDVWSIPATNGAANESLGLYDTRSFAAGVGGGIVFGGKFNTAGTMAQNFASIQGVKENATDGDFASAMLFMTRVNGGNPAERMRIASSGLVTLGAAGDTGLKLTVNGSVKSSSGGFQFPDGTTQASAAINSQWGQSGSSIFYSGGNVGIGTNAPASPLAVNGFVQSLAGGFKFPDGTTQSTAASGQAFWGVGTPANTIFYSGGSVGVGTNNPAGPLNVVAAGGLNSLFTSNGGDGFIRVESTVPTHPYADFVIAGTASTPYGEIRVGDSNAWRNLVLQSNGGAVGVGTTTPTAALHVKSAAGVSGDARRSIVAYDAAPSALGVGGGIAFGGNYAAATSTPPADFANIWGIKEVATDNDKSGALLFATTANGAAPAERMRIGSTGLVTIAGPGTGTRLRVNGDIDVVGNINAKYQDMAEWVPAAEMLPAGTVVVLDPSVSNQVMSSTAAYATTVAGVVSDHPGIILGERGASKVQVATTGRVKVKVDATKGAVHIGDLLVTSDQPGTAMKSQPIDVGGMKIHRPGTLIGKALEPLAGGQGEILVLLSLQ
jgi:predicted heme/steroid binding protein